MVVSPQHGDAGSLDADILDAAGHSEPGARSEHGTVLLVADPTLFASVATPFRLMVYSRADERALTERRGGAPFYLPGVAYMFSSLDGLTHYVVWSAHWVGGSFIARCTPAPAECSIERIDDWIT